MEKWIQRSLIVVTVALLSVMTACATGGSSGTATATGGGSSTVTATTGGASAHHGGGLELSTQASRVPTTALSDTLPSSVDLSRYNPPVTSEGSESMCAAFATGYYLRGWYANRDGYYPPSGFAPAFTYAQVPKYTDGDTKFSDNLNVEETEGLDTGDDYFPPITNPDGVLYPMADSGIAVTVAASPRGGAWVVNANGAIFELPSGEMRVWIGTSR